MNPLTDLERIGRLEIEVLGLKEEMHYARNQGEQTNDKISQIRDLLNRRPSWAVTFYLTAVTSLASGLGAVLFVRPG